MNNPLSVSRLQLKRFVKLSLHFEASVEELLLFLLRLVAVPTVHILLDESQVVELADVLILAFNSQPGIAVRQAVDAVAAALQRAIRDRSLIFFLKSDQGPVFYLCTQESELVQV